METKTAGHPLPSLPLAGHPRPLGLPAFTTTVVSDNPETLVVGLTPVASEIMSLLPHPPNRALAGIIEATVHATRYVMTGVPALWALIEQAAGTIRKCGGKEHGAALDALLMYCEE
ncbi:DUF447 family protein [Methanogenium sp. S4BF]|uniref:DUF447 family spectrin-like domain-containing protein n=1 Tax=Methanogenium sp. S4BF TaxID=1789226 RepID=UPI002417D72E|nr:DUF447 domain-containing protein [Methanogenium sp. S4BF]WFN35308.1 DUF447 family protein [Methanogenium sp. S4BF]